MKAALRAFLRITLILAFATTMSCENMLGDMGRDIAALEQEMLLLFQSKPLPEITLVYDGRDINPGELIDMGLTLEDAPKSITLTVRNSGAVNLDLAGITISGWYANRFTAGGIALPATLAPGAQTTFEITFQSAVVNDGFKAAVVSIATGEEYAPFNVTVACERTEELRAKMEVWRGSTLLSDSDPPYSMGTSPYCIFTVKNIGTAPLTAVSLTRSGDSVFSLASTPPPTIAEDDSASFRVDFDPVFPGTYSGTVTIDYHDGIGPGTFTLGVRAYAEVIPVPEIDLRDSDGVTSLPDPADHDFGGQAINTQGPAKEYHVYNTGTGDLTVSGISLDDPVNFVLNSSPSAVIVPGGHITFMVSYYPKTQAAHDATVTITSDDGSNGTFVLNLSGTSLQSNIGVTNSCGTIPYDFGSMGADGDYDTPGGKMASAPCTFTIHNYGNDELIIDSVLLSGTNPGDFDINTTGMETTIAAGGDTSFTVRFDPITNGVKAADITINSNDPDVGSFTFGLTGTGVTPMIHVTVEAKSIWWWTTDDDQGGDLEIYLDISGRAINDPPDYKDIANVPPSCALTVSQIPPATAPVVLTPVHNPGCYDTWSGYDLTYWTWNISKYNYYGGVVLNIVVIENDSDGGDTLTIDDPVFSLVYHAADNALHADYNYKNDDYLCTANSQSPPYGAWVINVNGVTVKRYFRLSGENEGQPSHNEGTAVIEFEITATEYY